MKTLILKIVVFSAVMQTSLVIGWASASFSISGSLSDRHGIPLQGCSVTFPEAGKTVKSDLKGNFWVTGKGIKLSPDKAPEENISFIKGDKLFLQVRQGPIHVSISIFDILGNPVAKVFDEQVPNGIFSLVPLTLFSGKLTHSIYFVRVQTGSKTEMWKLPNFLGPGRQTNNLPGLPSPQKTDSGRTALTRLIIKCEGFPRVYQPVTDYNLNLGQITIERPNLLFLLAEGISNSQLGGKQNRWMHTPSLDRLTSMGVRFLRVFLSGTPFNPVAKLAQPLWEAGYVLGTSKPRQTPALSNLDVITFPDNITEERFPHFLNMIGSEKPFCYWDSQILNGINHPPNKLQRPLHNLPAAAPFLPNIPAIRKSLLTQKLALMRFDNHVGRMLTTLENQGLLENTIIILTSTEGAPFSRRKGNLIDKDIRVPLLIAWGNKFGAKQYVSDLVTAQSLVPTILDATGIPPNAKQEGRSFYNLLIESLYGALDTNRQYLMTSMANYSDFASSVVRSSDQPFNVPTSSQ